MDASWLNSTLQSYFGDRVEIFRDHSDIEGGDDFPEKIETALKATRVLIAVIGVQWLTVRDEKTGGRRLENEKDFVRREIKTALDSGVHIIPLLVRDARPPAAEDLPADLQPLASKHALRIRSGEDFDGDMSRFIGALEKRLPQPWEPNREHGIIEQFEDFADKTPPGLEGIFGHISPPPVSVMAAVGFVVLFALLIIVAVYG